MWISVEWISCVCSVRALWNWLSRVHCNHLSASGPGSSWSAQHSSWITNPPGPSPACLFVSLMSGLAALDAKCSSRLGIMTISYYLWTTFVAVVVGIVMVYIIHPGGAAQKEDSEDSKKPMTSSADALLDLIRWEVDEKRDETWKKMGSNVLVNTSIWTSSLSR